MAATLKTVRGRIGIGAALLLCSGCFGYVPVEPGTLTPDREVRLELTRVGFAQLPEIPNLSGPDLSGRVVRQDATQLLLRVPVAIRMDGMVAGTVEQDVLIPTSEILKVERREFSRQRTAVMTAGGVGLLVAVINAFGKGGPPLGEEPERPIDEEAGSGATAIRASIPLFSILFR